MSMYWEFKADFQSLDENKIEEILNWLTVYANVASSDKEFIFLFCHGKRNYLLSSVFLHRGNKMEGQLREINMRDWSDWKDGDSITIGFALPFADNPENLDILKKSSVWADFGTVVRKNQEKEFNDWIGQLRLNRKDGKISFGVFYLCFLKGSKSLTIRPPSSDLSEFLFKSREFHELLKEFSLFIKPISAGIHFEGGEMGYSKAFVSKTRSICAYDGRLETIPAIEVTSAGVTRGPCFYPFTDRWGSIIADVMEKHLGWKRDANRLRELLDLNINCKELILNEKETRELKELLSWDGESEKARRAEFWNIVNGPFDEKVMTAFLSSADHAKQLRELGSKLPYEEVLIVENIQEIADFIEDVEKQGFVIKIGGQ
ncbi:MAG: hypothetical protein Q8Q37_01265 [bacterium]|nr:hypothetical protein [bacterium]